jgi:predicted extracellular nuclease
VCEGDTDETDAFDAAVEWDVFAQDTFDGLGSHTADCTDDPPPPAGQPLPFSDGFDNDDCTVAGWQVISVDADAANTWTCSAEFSNANVNGFGDDAPADEWLITPALDMDAQTDEVLSFSSWNNFTDNGTPHPQLEVVYATDYDGADPTTATWTALTGINFPPADSSVWTPSGDIDLSGIAGSNVYFAFHYVSSGTAGGEAANWRIDSVDFSVDDGSEPTTVFIHDVQGDGATTPLAGDTVTIQGIVTSLFESNDALDGFFVQEEDDQVDADPNTSEALFVFCRFGDGCPGALAVGDLVTVTGEATEFQNMTQIDTGSGSIVIDSSGNPLPTPVAIDLPASGSTEAEETFESIEGMITTVNGKLVVSEYFELGRYGQIVLTADERPEQFTDANPPSVDGYAAFLADLATRQIILDDNNSNQWDARSGNEPFAPQIGGLSLTNKFRGGDSITDLTGVIHWNANAWRVRQTDSPYSFTSENPGTATPDDVGGSLTVATFNVLNYFFTLDNPGNTCGPSNLGCRGANSVEERTRQRDKIVAAMAAIDADVLGLIEIENDEGPATADLVAGLNNVVGAGTYDYIDTGSIGTDAIKQALIFKPATVTPIGDFKILDSSVDSRFNDDKNRPALIQTFEENATLGTVTVAVNHLKSKGSDCDELDDPDLFDGQARCNLTRTSAAEALADYLAGDPTETGSTNNLIIGDLNAYAMEDPITALEAKGYTDMLELFQGSGAYTYLFDGQTGYLDYAMADANLVPQITGVTSWHINADEVPLFDYNDAVLDPGESDFFEPKSSALPIYAPDPFRASDHDPVIVGLDLDPGEPPVPTCNGIEATIVGTEGRDRIIGTNGPDVIVALGGNDFINSRGGDDLICAGDGNDVVNGSTGDDTMYGERGNDRMIGHRGDDMMFGGDGVDNMSGGSGDDMMDGGASSDRMNGQAGDDMMTGGDGDDRMIGGSGNDDMDGDADNDRLIGGSGLDDLSGGDDDDILLGGSSADTLDGGDGIDNLNGNGGIDTCTTGEVLRSCEL